MSVKVKICGVTTVEQAVHAAECGTDAIGLMFYEKSSRFLEARRAREIARELPPFCSAVAVFVNPTADQVRQALEEVGVDLVQLHGDESPEFCAQFSGRIIKAFRVRSAESLLGIAQYASRAWLLDSYVDGQYGGAGESFNWDLAIKAKDAGRPIILAGGLTPENVADAVTQVRPYGVDVSSGVESEPGVKEQGKVEEFIRRAKGV